MRTRRRTWLVLLPIAAALLLILAIPARGDRYDVTVTMAVWFALLLAGGLVAAAILVVVGLRWLAERQRGRARTEAMAAAQTERIRLLLRLDHELKNPLTAINVGVANLADSLGPDRPADRQVLDSIGGQAHRLGRLVADLRKLAELESGPIECAPIDITELLREIEEAIGEMAHAYGVDVTVSVPQAPWPLPPVVGDRDLVFLALHNLAVNAVKFSNRGDVLEIRGFEEADRVVVEVADTGAGIPAAEADHVWEELSRGQAARGVPGTGLGLALVRVIAHRHGGVVALRSREGEGTVVTIRLPAMQRT
jgi:two-component system OmpR family sensor kinase